MKEVLLDFEDPLKSRTEAPHDAKNGELYVVEAISGWYVAMFHNWMYIDLDTNKEICGDILQYARLPERKTQLMACGEDDGC